MPTDTSMYTDALDNTICVLYSFKHNMLKVETLQITVFQRNYYLAGYINTRDAMFQIQFAIHTYWNTIESRVDS